MNGTFRIKRGDTSPALEYTLGIHAEGGAVLAGAAATFHMKALGGSAAKVDAAATITDDDGVLVYEWDAADTDTAGVFLAEFEVTYADDSVETFPGDGWITVTVGVDLA